MNKNTEKLNDRQKSILRIFENTENPKISVGEIVRQLADAGVNVTRMTVNRDIDLLIDAGYVQSFGAGRGSAYALVDGYRLIKSFDSQEYFTTQALLRDVQESFNSDVFDYFKIVQYISDDELHYLESIHREHKTKIHNFKENSATAMKRELERLIIDLAWKSSQIEGNTYDIFETEALIKEGVKASDKTDAEAIMILNHKKAVDFIMSNQDYFREITVKKVQELHSVLIDGLGVESGLRSTPVRITGTKYTPLFDTDSIASALSDMVDTINIIDNPFKKALAALALLAYIQPFQDGNKRTSRLLANAILYAHGYSMLSYSSADAVEYRKAIILFYEQNSLAYLKDIFIQQYKFAVENYFV